MQAYIVITANNYGVCSVSDTYADLNTAIQKMDTTFIDLVSNLTNSHEFWKQFAEIYNIDISEVDKNDVFANQFWNLVNKADKLDNLHEYIALADGMRYETSEIKAHLNFNNPDEFIEVGFYGVELKS